ncbi:pyruvate dehydrogenase E2 component (dihydrolipoamide acetyltransferase) [Leifsonia sp. EB41]|uniref:dihydrolipoamide acetyltransferase family protein n=1 Tax=Leifsonia sp. EB41 TaxID=3156260 RepID=UPI00351979F9
MAEIIRMPEVLAGAAEAAIQTWLVAPGASVSTNQAIAEVETDKAIVELQSEFEGIVGRVLAAEGDSVAVGDPILVLLGTGEGEDAIAPALAATGLVTDQPPRPEDQPPRPTTQQPRLEAQTGNEPAPEVPDSIKRRFISPLVRRRAREHGIEIGLLTGTGPEGRVVRRDLERYLQERLRTSAEAGESGRVPEAPTLAADAPVRVDESTAYSDVPLDRMRKAIARRLTESKSTVPHFYLVADCNVDRLVALRQEINLHAPRKISVNDLVIKAVSAAMMEVPEANAIWNTDSIRRFSSVDLAVAVATDGGLTTPVLRGVERMPLTEVSATVADLAERARSGRLMQHELEGGSFAISNLGMYGTDAFTAILNPPQSGILAVGAARKAPVVDSEGRLAVASVMTVSLSADHRVLDGAVAAQWLAALRRRIEDPFTILI